MLTIRFKAIWGSWGTNKHGLTGGTVCRNDAIRKRQTACTIYRSLIATSSLKRKITTKGSKMTQTAWTPSSSINKMFTMLIQTSAPIKCSMLSSLKLTKWSFKPKRRTKSGKPLMRWCSKSTLTLKTGARPPAKTRKTIVSLASPLKKEKSKELTTNQEPVTSFITRKTSSTSRKWRRHVFTRSTLATTLSTSASVSNSSRTTSASKSTLSMRSTRRWAINSILFWMKRSTRLAQSKEQQLTSTREW